MNVEIDLDWVRATPELDTDQSGSLRRIINLSDQLADDWSGMQGRTTLQEDFGALRFQLAYMSYALALTHVHRLPAAPAAFKDAFDRLIQKILSPDCWLYWHYISTGNGPYNASLGELPAEWDPMIRDNIMYSAYVQSMVLLFQHLFDDDRYCQPGALTLSIHPLFWGAGGKHFKYDARSLNEHLYWNMVERGYLGIACEPNCVFQICNQPPILGFRLHDLVFGGNTADEVTEGYLRAWSEFGITTEDGRFNMMVQEAERALITPPDSPWVDFWLGSLMHAWNPETVRNAYPGQMARWSRTGPDDTLWIQPAMPLTADGPSRPTARDFGWACVCASEMGDGDSLDKLLRYADRFLHPVRKDGSLHYARHDAWFDDGGNFVAMDPHTGNALLGYARLNVPGGLQKIYEGAWAERDRTQPAVIAASGRPDFRRAWFDPERSALALTLGEHAEGDVALTIAAPGRARPSVWRDGERADDLLRQEGDAFQLDVPAPARTTLVLQW